MNLSLMRLTSMILKRIDHMQVLVVHLSLEADHRILFKQWREVQLRIKLQEAIAEAITPMNNLSTNLKTMSRIGEESSIRDDISNYFSSSSTCE